MNEKTIAEKMVNTKIYPAEAVEMRMQLAGLYAFYSEELSGILLYKAQNWPTLRLNHKSDKQADLQWYGTPEGILETSLTMKMKRIEKMLSSLKSLIDHANTEYHYAKI